MAERLQSRSAQLSRTDSPGLAFKCIWIFMVANAIVLVAVIVLAVAAFGESPSVFMWTRAIILVGGSAALLRWARRADSGDEGARDRLRVVSVVLPVAVVVVDLIPGIAPVWYGVLQAIGALALIPVAVVTRRRFAGAV